MKKSSPAAGQELLDNLDIPIEQKVQDEITRNPAKNNRAKERRASFALRAQTMGNVALKNAKAIE